MDDFKRNGFSLVELLASTAIVAGLVAIVLPAINAARESTRRTACIQRIGQLALAVENHQAAHGVYPPGRFLGKYGSGPRSRAWSWLAMSLPFLEQQALFDEGNIPESTLEVSSAPPAYIEAFVCPSAAGDFTTPTRSAGNLIGFPVGQTTYKGVSGANWGADRSLGKWSVRTRFRNEGANGSHDGLDDGDGILWRSDISQRMSYRRVTDGASKTLLIGEDLPRHNIWSSWPYANNAYGTCAIPPNFLPHDPTWQYETYSFRSDHRGGLTFALADGSVRFVSTQVDMSVYKA